MGKNCCAGWHMHNYKSLICSLLSCVVLSQSVKMLTWMMGFYDDNRDLQLDLVNCLWDMHVQTFDVW